MIGGRLHLGTMPPLGGELEPVGHVVTDVREVRSGDVFWAVESSPTSTAARAEEAFARDAAGAVVSGRELEPWAGKFSVLVDDPQIALCQLARRVRARFTGSVVAVTGSIGKTTTRRMIAAVLAEVGKVWSTDRAADDPLGVPLSLLELGAEQDYGLVEYDAGEPERIRVRSHLCDPQIVVINSLANHRMGTSDDAATRCEAELLDVLSQASWVVLNGDAPRSRELGEQTDARVLQVGRGSHCDVMASQIRSRDGELSLVVDGTAFRVPVWGRHHVYAVLAAIGVGRILDVPLEQVADALAHVQPLPQRCEVIRRRDLAVIDDTYDAREASLEAALELVRDFETAGRRVVVCGELAGSGNDTERHQRIGQALVARWGVDLLVTCGRYSTELTEAAQAAGMPARRTLRCQRADEAAARVQALVRPGDVVLVKGGLNMTLAAVVAALRCESRARSA
jgi:UDP-N-acetylmuramoyl-tripeptide--D-alanyl-D-alanine ligase